MMAGMRLQAVDGHMGCTIMGAPAFPDQFFNLGVPESIGNTAKSVWANRINPRWEQVSENTWKTFATSDGELDYTFLFELRDDYIDIKGTLTNKSTDTWPQSFAFNCFNCGRCEPISDFECVRHYVGVNGSPTRLIEVPRVFSPRPTVQLYSVQGAPPGKEIPFVDRFKATPDIVLDNWMAIESRDRTRLVAVVSNPALFLFQNMEYSCIHSAPSFGRMEPGQTANALTRIYLVETTLEAWYARMKQEIT